MFKKLSSKCDWKAARLCMCWVWRNNSTGQGGVSHTQLGAVHFLIRSGIKPCNVYSLGHKSSRKLGPTFLYRRGARKIIKKGGGKKRITAYQHAVTEAQSTIRPNVQYPTPNRTEQKECIFCTWRISCLQTIHSLRRSFSHRSLLKWFHFQITIQDFTFTDWNRSIYWTNCKFAIWFPVARPDRDNRLCFTPWSAAVFYLWSWMGQFKGAAAVTGVVRLNYREFALMLSASHPLKPKMFLSNIRINY